MTDKPSRLGLPRVSTEERPPPTPEMLVYFEENPMAEEAYYAPVTPETMPALNRFNAGFQQQFELCVIEIRHEGEDSRRTRRAAIQQQRMPTKD